MSCVCKIKCIHWNAAILLYFFCFIFIFMTTLISSKPISNICRACKLSNLAQQLGEGEGYARLLFQTKPQTQDQMGCTKTYVSPTLFFQTKFYCETPCNPPPNNVFYKKINVCLAFKQKKKNEQNEQNYMGEAFAVDTIVIWCQHRQKKNVCISWHIFFISLERTYMYRVTKFPFSCVRNMSWMANCFGKS